MAWDPQARRTTKKLVRLFVSDDRGTTWKRVSDHKPGDKRAPFRADRDGDFWFALQMQQHRTDRWSRPWSSRLTPAMKVRVVTEKTEPAVRTESIAKSAPAASLAETLERKGYVAIELEKMRTGYFGVRVKVGDKKF